ncbi:hypothetical protein PV05_03327 [Exophiala xenobiotica]|uniref:Uncharacterized protein n=1 Tax=Exophiala xenobiotica TaxID=348802 RepID=A0A0D2ESW7_9EURO|nr:uncharacterized protein PV05_03327 [Exophiala xenobiotica]KIW58833.1 hypothetical protein PV05_03327 [Exophiala xenobiotica]
MPEKPRDDSAKVPKENTSRSAGNSKPVAQNGAGRSPTSDRSDTSFMSKTDPTTSRDMEPPNRKEKH